MAGAWHFENKKDGQNDKPLENNVAMLQETREMNYHRIEEEQTTVCSKCHRKEKGNNKIVSLLQWWDVGMVQIRQFTQQYTLNIPKELARQLEFLEKEIIDFQQKA